MLTQVMYQGDGTKVIPVRPDIADSSEVISEDWICKTSVIASDGTTTVPVKTVNTKSDDGLFFFVSLTPEETALLDVVGSFSNYFWVIQLSNALLSPAYSKEKHIPLVVRKSGID